MDNTRAKHMSEELIGSEVGGWLLSKLLGFGKSALVLAGSKDKAVAAIKIFDPELVEHFGREIQKERITRELELCNHDHPHLIKIFGGGECEKSKHLYVVMELVEWPSLDKLINQAPREKIWPLIDRIASAARFLEERHFAHRDIKPSNIVVRPDFDDAKLLDLGVIHTLGYSDLTDDEAKPFIGTLRYSSPEFLYRKEEDTIDGWRAVTFYQLGGVLHDLIVRKPLFEQFSEPYAKLVTAVTKETPVIEATDVDPDLVVLARGCLSKDPALRLRLVSWSSFAPRHQDTSHAVNLKQRLAKRRQEAEFLAASDDDMRAERQERHSSRVASEILSQVEALVRGITVTSELLPPAKFNVSQNPEKRIGHLITRFEPCKQYALEVPLTIYMIVTVLQPDEKVVQLQHAVAVGGPILQAKEYEVKLKNGYLGAFENAVLQGRLDLLFHEAMDLTLRLPHESIKVDQAYWLDLEIET